MNRKWLAVAGAALVFIFATLVVVWMGAGKIIKVAIETIGPQLTKTEVIVGSVFVSPFSGSGTLYGLVVGNPPGNESKTAIKINRIKMAVDLPSLKKDVIVFRKIELVKPQFVW